MKTLFLLLLLSVGLTAAPLDLIMSQAKSPGPGNIQVNVPAQNAITSASLPSFQSGIGLGVEDTPNFTGVSYGVTTPGSITGLAGALTLTAAGTDQSITLTPSGTGAVVTSKRVAQTFTSVASTPMILSDGAWFSGGSTTTTKPAWLVEPAGTTSTGWSTSGTGIGINSATGFAGRLLDAQVAGATQFNITSAGSVVMLGSMNIGVSASYRFTGSSEISAPSDGVLRLRNAAATDFGRLQFGGTTSSFPSLKRVGTTMAVRLADDSADAPISFSNSIGSGINIVSTDTLSGVGAVSITRDTTKLTSTGVAQAITLADGVDGQIKRIIHDVDGGSMVLTPTTKTGFSTITFTNAGDTVTLEFATTRGWFVMGNYGTIVTP